LSSKPELEIFISNGEIGLKIKCLVDTGCSKTVISNSLVSSIIPEICGEETATIYTIHGESKSNMYIVYIRFDNHTNVIRTDVGAQDELKGYHIILGMDIIQEGKLIIDKGILSFEIDYLK
jgi:predicted aspartyl protease